MRIVDHIHIHINVDSAKVLQIRMFDSVTVFCLKTFLHGSYMVCKPICIYR